MDKQREQFETWAKERYAMPAGALHPSAWEAWKAALSTQHSAPTGEVELPPLPEPDATTDVNGKIAVRYFSDLKVVEYARAALRAYGQRAAQEPLQWTPGPNEWKDWCTQYFGPDADDTYLAEAVFNLPLMAQRFERSVLPSTHPQAVYLLEQVMRPYGIYDIAVGNSGALQMEFIELGKQMRAFIASAAPSQPQQEAVPAEPSRLQFIEVPREHTEHEDCNCEAVGYAKGWNAAIAMSAAKEPGGKSND